MTQENKSLSTTPKAENGITSSSSSAVSIIYIESPFVKQEVNVAVLLYFDTDKLRIHKFDYPF